MSPGSTNWRWPMDGKIDDVRIYSNALSAAEVTALYNMGVPLIASVVADDPNDDDVLYDAGDTITILFDVATNQPAAATGANTGFASAQGYPEGSRACSRAALLLHSACR